MNDDIFEPFRQQVALSSEHGAVHHRVLEVAGDGERVAVMALWSAPTSPEDLHVQVKNRLEAYLLADLSNPWLGAEGDGFPGPDDGATQAAQRLDELWLVSTCTLPAPKQALQAFGLDPVTEPTPLMDTITRMLRAEHTQHTGGEDMPEPVAWHRCPCRVPGPREVALEQTLRAHDHVPRENPWGADPGSQALQLMRALEHRDPGDALDHAESLLFGQKPATMRVCGPASFLAFCDLCALYATLRLKRSVQWALSEPDGQGLAPPPLVRWQEGDGPAVHIPLGLEVLRWLIMPLAPDETPPTFRERLDDLFKVTGP